MEAKITLNEIRQIQKFSFDLFSLICGGWREMTIKKKEDIRERKEISGGRREELGKKWGQEQSNVLYPCINMPKQNALFSIVNMYYDRKTKNKPKFY